MKKTNGQFKISRERVCLCIVVLLILSFIPLLLIARYNHPCADDFSYGRQAAAAWRETGRLSPTIQAAINGTREVYNTWQGTFTAVFLMSLHPAIFGEGLYALVPVILILGLVASTAFFLKVVLIDYMEADKYSFGIIASIISFLSVQFVISPVEAFYWYNGAMYYTGFYALSLTLFSLVLLSAKSTNTMTNIVYAVLTSFLSFLIGGSNFVIALTSLIITALFLAHRVIFRRGVWLAPLLGLAAMCVAFFISISAPGNAVRQMHFQGMNPILAVITSFGYAFRFVTGFVRAPVILAFACIVSTVYKIARNSKFTFRLPGLVTALTYGVYASSYTPNLYAMSSLGPARVANVNYYYFLLFLLVTLVYWCGWIARKVSTQLPQAKGKKSESKRDASVEPGIIGILAVCFILSCVVIADRSADSMTSVSAIKSLVTGEASSYHEEQLSRLAVYTDADANQIEVSALTAKPYVLYFDDITTDSTDWRNTALTNYYGKDSAVIVD